MLPEGKIETNRREDNQRQQRLTVLGKELDYLLPSRHRFFAKHYAIGPQGSQLPLLMRDMEEYHQMLASQNSKILAYLHDYQLEPALNTLVAALLRFHQHFAEQGIKVVGRTSWKDREQKELKKEQQKCSQCSRILNEYRVEQLREELKLDRFEDPYKFFNIDHLNFGELERLQRESKVLLQGELSDENPFEFQGGCISLQQYDEVLNLLGSDMHQKNTSIQKIIDYLSKTDKRLLGEEKEGDRRGVDEELRLFQGMVAGDTIKRRLRDIMRLFLNKYHQKKVLKRRDAEAQANIKENDVIRQLQQDKRQLRGRILAIIADKERMAKDYQSKLREAQMQIDTTTALLKEQSAKAAEDILQLEQRLSEQRHLHDLHKAEIERLTNQFVTLQVLFNRSSVLKETHSNSKRTSRPSVRKSKNKDKIKGALKRQRNSFSEPTDNFELESAKNLRKGKGSSGKLRDDASQEDRKVKRRQSASLWDANKVSYSKIDQKQEEEEESEAAPRLKQNKRKTSRFKALMNHYTSNPNIQHTVNNITSLSSFSQLHPAGKESEDGRIDMLIRLYQNQKANHKLTVAFPHFMQLYNHFVSSIDSQSALRRSSSLKPRASILNQDPTLPSRTAKSIQQEVQKQKRVQKNSKQGEKSSKLQPLERHSQFYLKKVPKVQNKFQFKNYSKTADNTARNGLTSIKDVPNIPVLPTCFDEEDLDDIFLGKDNILQFSQMTKPENQPSQPQENQLLMKMYAEMAALHMKNPKIYEEIKGTLAHPKQVLEGQPLGSNHGELKAVMKRVVRLHRKCKKQKGSSECLHLQRLLNKIRHFQQTTQQSTKQVNQSYPLEANKVA